MTTNSNITENRSFADAQTWIKETLNKAVFELVDQDIFDEVLVEAKPAWVFPDTFLIGKIRNKDSAASTRWFICGDCKTLHFPEELATSPRAAMRHFALMWQAQLGENVDPNDKDQLIALEQAETLYDMSEIDQFWQSS